MLKEPRNLSWAWLLTPVVVGVGAFLIGWAGALLGHRLMWLVVGGLVGGLIGLGAWSALVLFPRKRQTPEEP